MTKPSTISAKALARSYRTERTLTTVTGLLAVAIAAVVLVAGAGWLGEFRARRPVLDPLVLDWLGGLPPWLARGGAIAAGVLLAVLGLWWLARSLRPERRPDLELDHTDGRTLTVTASALAGAVRADAEGVAGVVKARVRSVGDAAEPALRLRLWLREGSDLRQVWHELDTRVLARARDTLGVDVLPAAVRFELGSAQRRRVR